MFFLALLIWFFYFIFYIDFLLTTESLINILTIGIKTITQTENAILIYDVEATILTAKEKTIIITKPEKTINIAGTEKIY